MKVARRDVFALKIFSVMSLTKIAEVIKAQNCKLAELSNNDFSNFTASQQVL